MMMMIMMVMMMTDCFSTSHHDDDDLLFLNNQSPLFTVAVYITVNFVSFLLIIARGGCVGIYYLFFTKREVHFILSA